MTTYVINLQKGLNTELADDMGNPFLFTSRYMAKKYAKENSINIGCISIFARI